MKSRVDKIAEVVFFIALLIEVLIVIIDKSALINPIEGRLFQLTFVLCMLKITMTKHNLKEWILIVLFLALGFVSDRITDRNEIIRFVAFIAASKGIDGRKALKMVLYTSLIGVLALVVLSLSGVLGNVYLETDFAREIGIERRYCLGLGHPNALHCMFWALLTLGVYLYLDRLKWWHYVVLFGANLGLFVLTGSRTGFITSFLVILCAGIYAFWPKIRAYRSLYAVGALALLCSVAFSIDAATYNGYYDAEKRPIIHWIDTKLTGRIFEGGITGSINKWSLFSDSGVKGYTDMGYIKLFHWYGIIPACLYLIAIILLIKYCYKMKNAAALILITSFNLYTLVEAHAISPYFGRNYLLMMFFGIWSAVFNATGGNEAYWWQFKAILNKCNVLEE